MCFPHIVAYNMIAPFLDFLTVYIILGHGCIRQMLKLVSRIVGVVVLTREPKVGRSPKPDRQRVDTGDDDPLPDIELFPKNNQRSFNIFLDHPARKIADPDSLHHLFNIRVDFDAATSGLGARFYDPEIAVVSQTELFSSEQVLELGQNSRDLDFKFCGFYVNKSAGKWSIPSCSKKVDCNIRLAQEAVHGVTDVVELIGCELVVGLEELCKELARQNRDSSFSDGYGDR